MVNKRALVVYYEGDFFFPTYGEQFSGKDFGLGYDYEVDYRELKRKFTKENKENWVLMPLVPYGPYEWIIDWRGPTDFRRLVLKEVIIAGPIKQKGMSSLVYCTAFVSL